MTPWVRRLLIANVVMFVVAQPGTFLYRWLLYYPVATLVTPWTPFTYMFLHGGLGHILFNMIGLFFFGPRLEERLGGGDFLKLYILSGLGGAVFSLIFSPTAAVVGASAAVYGVLLGFAVFWPRERIYIWGILPIEAWLLAVILVALSLWAGVSGAQAGVAHFAHLGGLAFGFAYLKWRTWRREAPRREFQKRVQQTPSSGTSEKAALKRWEAIDVGRLHELNREEVIHLLRKARAMGVRSLSPEERAFLDRFSGAH